MNIYLIILVGLIVSIALFFVVSSLLKKWNRSNSANNPKDIGTIFYHEDDYCQVQLLPRENYPNLIKQAKNISDLSKNNFDGNGWSEIKIRDEIKVKISDRHILPQSLDETLLKLKSIKHTVVITGYGENHRVLSKNTIGYGEDYIAMYYDFDKVKIQNIWMTNVSSFNENKATKVLLELGKKWNLILMDWNSLELIDLNKKEEIENYLN